MPLLLTILILGIVEGVTEFIPVSSTGHLILASELLGYDAAQWEVFNVVIQLGAILAVIVLYWRTFWAVLIGLFHGKAESWRFVRNVLIAFLPSAVLGSGEVAIALRTGVYPPGTNLEATIDGREHVYLPQGTSERSEDYVLVRFREMIREA